MFNETGLDRATNKFLEERKMKSKKQPKKVNRNHIGSTKTDVFNEVAAAETLSIKQLRLTQGGQAGRKDDAFPLCGYVEQKR